MLFALLFFHMGLLVSQIGADHFSPHHGTAVADTADQAATVDGKTVFNFLQLALVGAVAWILRKVDQNQTELFAQMRAQEARINEITENFAALKSVHDHIQANGGCGPGHG